MLTAIVINFGITALLLALIYRSWWLARLGDEGDVVGDEHADGTSDDRDALRSTSDDDDAVHDSLEELSRGTDESSAPLPADAPVPTREDHE